MSTRTPIRRRWPILVAVSVAASLGTGIVSDAASRQPAWASRPSSAADGGTLRIVVPSEPRSLNQAIDNTDASVAISKLVLDRLASIDPATGQPAPGLVDTWERTDDTTWTLHLRDDVTFSDGEPFDADAAVLAIDTVRDPSNSYSPYVRVIDDAAATDDSTVTLTTTQPIGYVPALLSIIPAVAPDAFAAATPDDFGREPVGSGPFLLESWQPGVVMVLTRNDAYWGEAPSIERVEITWNSEAESRVALLETGEVDIAKSVPPQLVDRVSSGGGLSIASAEALGPIIMQFNQSTAPFDDLRVRQAVAQAIDRDALVDVVFSGVGAVAWQSIFPPSYDSGQVPDGALGYDPDAARAIVDELGDVTIPLYFPNGRYVLDAQVGEALAGMLEDVGFTVDRHPMEVGAYFDLLLTQEMPGAHLLSAGATFPHEAYLLDAFFLPTSVVTYCAQEDLVEPAAEAAGLDGDERAAAYAEIARRLVVDDVCPVPLYIETLNWGVSDDVQGFTPAHDEALNLVGVTVGGS